MNEQTTIRNAVIKTALIDDADRDFLNVSLGLDMENGSIVFGGYTLYLPKSYKHHRINSGAGHFIWRCMQIGGVSSFAKLQGKIIRVRFTGNATLGDRIEAIGHAINDDWFCPREELQKAEAEMPAQVAPLAEGDLLPCPFCGTEAKLHDSREYYVTCTSAGMCVGNHSPIRCTYREDAIEIWNRRA